MNGEIDEYGNVILYHRTTIESKRTIEYTSIMTAKENGLFCSTKEKGQNEGYGAAVIKLKIPVEKLVIDDHYGDEIHFRYPIKAYKADVSSYIIRE